MQRPLSLWIIDPSLREAEGQGTAEMLRGWSGTSRLFLPALKPGDGPAPGTGYDTDGVVLLGSSASVHDRHAWIEPLAAWLRPILDGEERVPLFGVCFGHQMVAHLADGGVDWIAPDRRKVLGVQPTRLAGGRLLPGEREMRVVVSHREEVKAVPHGFRLSASRAESAIDGLEHETLPIYSFQFHPEAREEFAGRSGIDVRALDSELRRDNERLIHAFHERVELERRG